jgi:glycosyltransferase involved in cell wall biosynthesis
MVDDYDLKCVSLHTATSDVIVATSARIKRELEELAGRPLPNAIVKPNGVDSSRFNASLRAPSSSNRIFRGVAVNRIHAKKGVTYLVDAVKLLRNRGIPFTLEICGEYDTHDEAGPAYFAQLKQFVAENKLDREVTFLGRQTAAQIRQHLCEKDIFCAPFVELANGDKDGIPTALLEAMAGGCAIVATDAGSITEVIDDETEGLLVPQCNAPAIANAIARLIADDTLRTRVANAALARVRREFDVSVCETRFHERVHAAIAQRRVIPA